MDKEVIKNLDYLDEYTIDDMGLDSLCWELKQRAEGKNAKIYIRIIEVENG